MRASRLAFRAARAANSTGSRAPLFRAMATEAAAQGGGGGGFIKGLLFGAALGGGSMYAYNAGLFDAKVTQTVVRQASVDYKKVREEVAALLQEDDNRGPLLVRLAWHASGTYDKNTRTGGSNGATMRFKPESDHGANAGLQLARALLEPIKQRHPGITYADLWTLAGAVSIEELGGPAIPWRPGRKDAVDGSVAPPDGRLPDAAQEQNHIRAVFGRMGFNDREMVALIGAHTLGRCHTDRSGYTGPWTRAPTTFSNLYFKELVENKWTKKKWSGPEQFEDPTGDLMMLPTDMALLHDPEFRRISKEYAADEEAFFKDFASAFSKLMELGVPFETAK